MHLAGDRVQALDHIVQVVAEPAQLIITLHFYACDQIAGRDTGNECAIDAHDAL